METHSQSQLSTIEEETSITGQLSRVKDTGKMMFGEVSQGTSTVSSKFIYIGSKEESSSDIVALREAPVGSSVTITGILKDAPKKSTQKYELHILSAVVHSVVEDPATYPYGLKMHKKLSPEEATQRLTTIRSDTYRRFRDKTFQSIMRLRGYTYSALATFFGDRGFIKIDSPILTESDCEGAGEMFTVTTLDMTTGHSEHDKDFFGKKMHLTVSGQLEVEAAARALMKVYTHGRTFRAEHSKTRRHLAEFEMLEPEQVFTHPDPEKRFEQLMDLEEDMVKHVIRSIFGSDSALSDLSYLDETFDSGVVEQLKSCIEEPFTRITYTEAVGLLQKHVAEGGQFDDMDLFWGMDLASEHEKWLCEQVFLRPVFVTHYPQDLKSFYMKADTGCSEDRVTCQAVDLLVPGIGELCGGSMREDCPEKLEAVMAKKKVSKEGLQWYIDLRKDGGLPTGGFGLGFARLVSFITGGQHVRDVVPFPRSYDA